MENKSLLVNIFTNINLFLFVIFSTFIFVLCTGYFNLGSVFEHITHTDE